MRTTTFPSKTKFRVNAVFPVPEIREEWTTWFYRG